MVSRNVFWGANSPLRAGMGMVGPVRRLKRGLGRGKAASRKRGQDINFVDYLYDLNFSNKFLKWFT